MSKQPELSNIGGLSGVWHWFKWDSAKHCNKSFQLPYMKQVL